MNVLHAVRLGIGTEWASIRWGAALIALLAAAMLITVASMAVVLGDMACDADFRRPGCTFLIPAFAPWEQTAQLLIGLLWVVPTGLGALLGVAITAGEIERGAAQVSWPLARSRARWLLLRAAPVALILIVILGVAAGFAELTTRARLISDDVGFHDYQLRTALVPLRGVLAFSIGLAVGAIFGRTLPALMVALAFSAAVTVGLLGLVQAWQVGAATLVPIDQLSIDNGSYPLAPIRSAVAGPRGDSFVLIEASEFWVWVGREAALLVTAGIAALFLAMRIVQRRSP